MTDDTHTLPFRHQAAVMYSLKHNEALNSAGKRDPT